MPRDEQQSTQPERTLIPRGIDQPVAFTQAELTWHPWLAPLDEGDLTDRHWAALVDRSRSKSPYFMLLARDPDILGSRTRADKDIFYNTKGGLSRGERELAATATSRFNGCVYCAGIHARFGARFSKREDDVRRLLDEGVEIDLDPRWNAVISASVALSRTPAEFNDETVDRLAEAGLDDGEISDVIHGAAFFNWANRLMLSLGEPSL